MKLWTTLFVFLSFGDAFPLKNCPKNCVCNEEREDTSIYCPSESNPSIDLTISPNHRAKLTCFDNRINLFDLNVNLRNVTSLYLTDCELQGNLTSNIFSSAPNITILNISANKLRKLPDNLLHSLKNLSAIYLRFDGYFRLTDEFFKENNNLESIRFRGGNISEISPNAFDNLSHLKLISFYDSQLTHLRLGTFDKTVNLDTLILGENQIASLPEGIFENLTNLTKLDLSGNKLTKWSQKLYNQGLQSLESLNLGGNNLKEIQDGSFSNMLKLEKLILRGNKIKKISMYAFNQGSSLIHLDLSSNKLKGENQELFNYLTQLKQLNLDDNFYDRIPEVISGNCTISMKNNNLTTLYMSSVLNYRHVALSNNKIGRISFELVHYMFEEGIESSVKLDIDNNPIVCDCHLLQLVKYFDGTIDKRIKKGIEIEVGDTNCIESENLKHTPVKNITVADLTCKYDICPSGCDCSVFPVNNTLQIDCSSMNLTEAPVSIEFAPFDMPGFEIRHCAVNLKNNFITKFVENENYANVTTLSLANNNLSDIAWLPPNIQVLELSNNLLTSLDDGVISFLENSSSLTKLSLHDNPWKCDCSLVSFTNAVRVNLSGKLEEKLLCDNGENLHNLSEGELCRTHSEIVVILSGISTGLVLLSVIILIVLYHIYGQPIKMWLYNHSMCMRFVTEDEIDTDKEFDAFVSYSVKDQEFIEKQLVYKLEKEEGVIPYKLCVHSRDWVVGELIDKQIIESVDKSRRTIIVLSENFLESSWAMTEFRTAHEKAVSCNQKRIILIAYDDIDVAQIEDEELKEYIRSAVYIKWGDPWFWEKLRYALPHKKSGEVNSV